MELDKNLYKLICDDLWTEIKEELEQEGFYNTRAFFRLPEEEAKGWSNDHTMRVISETELTTKTLEYLMSYEDLKDRGFIGIIFLRHEKEDSQKLIKEIIETTKADTLILIYQTWDSKGEECLCILIETKKERWCSTTPIFKMDNCAFLPDELSPFVHAQRY